MINFFRFDGRYGGDEYNRNLEKTIGSYLPTESIIIKRRGPVKTFFNMFLCSKIYKIWDGIVIRPFGLPVFGKHTFVIFHHYDHTGLKIYSRLIEYFDFFAVRIFSKFSNVHFICVSKYWEGWLKYNNFKSTFLIYNEIDVPIKVQNISKHYISTKYCIPLNKRWIFLGGSQAQKGWAELVNNDRFSAIKDSVFIISGKNVNCDKPNLFTVWFESEDYLGFLSNCSLVLANSKFKEGWCRVLHESALCNTPITGNGSGGMSELLTLSKSYQFVSVAELIDLLIDGHVFEIPDSECLKNHISLNNINTVLSLVQRLNQLIRLSNV